MDGPLAIELQHQSDQFIERINGYFGYRAIAELRILQAPLTEIGTTSIKPTTQTPRPKDVVAKRRQAELANIGNPALRAALTGLARRVEAAQRS